MKQYIKIVGNILSGFSGIAVVAVIVILVFAAVQRGISTGKQIVEQETAGGAPLPVTITIEENDSTERIAEILEENDLISNKYIFWFQSRLNGTYKLFKAGEYDLNKSMTPNEIMETLQKEQYAENHLTFTVPEGLSLKQIGALAESKDYFTEEAFLEACTNFGIEYSFFAGITRPNKIEGYLFPDTYFLPENPEPYDLIIRMINRFEEVTANYRRQAEEQELTFDQVITIASIIEKETKRADERPLVSSIIKNRLNDSMKLEMISTIMYVIDKPKDRLLNSDFEVDSPYNTFKNAGLPIGPISNPGEVSIEAALNPMATNYLYFVLKDETTNEHVFTADFGEYSNAVEAYGQQF